MEGMAPKPTQKEVKRAFFHAYVNIVVTIILFGLYLVGRQHSFEDSHAVATSTYYSMMRYFNWLAFMNLAYTIYLFYKAYKLKKQIDTANRN